MNVSSTVRKGWRSWVSIAPAIILLVVYFVSIFFPPTLVFEMPRLVSIIDGVGAYIALNLAILLYLVRDYHDGDNFIAHSWGSAGLAAIGVFKLASSMTEDMDYTLWAHVAERICGALCFVGAWLIPGQKKKSKLLNLIPGLSFVFASVVAAVLFAFRHVPAFSGTELVLGVRVLNPVAGFLFLLAAYLWHGKPGPRQLNYIGTIYSALFFYAGSSLFYPFSYLWGPRWWMVQFLELAPFVIAFVEKIRAYSRAQVQLLKTKDALSEANQKLELSRNELARSNGDLERFTDIAAHDLQEPVRTISIFLTLLEKRISHSLDKDSVEYLGYAKDGAGRMKSLIAELLRYSKVTQVPLRRVPTDCEQVLANVLRNLTVAIRESGGEITHGELPMVLTNSVLLEQLLQNLISNALKYHGNKPPRIEIGVRLEDDEWIFSVKDHGEGIAPEARERIFEMFQRLHGREIPGTGLGLATCRKIVTHLGGRIWVDSELGVGSEFHFSIPEASEPVAPLFNSVISTPQ